MKKKMIIGLLVFSTMSSSAQIDWNSINLAGTEAKILNVPKEPAINFTYFETKEGKIQVFLPPLTSGVTLSGTVYLEPNGKTSKDSSRNLEALRSNLLKLGDILIKAERGSFNLQIPPSGSTGIQLQLQSSTGQLINTQTLPFTTTNIPAGNFSAPAYAVSTDAATIKGSFDGNLANTLITVNGQKAIVLAESPSRIYMKTPGNITGPATIQCNEGGTTQTARTNIISLELSAGKTNLRKGENTQIHIKVVGLEGLSANVPVNITNTSPSVINLEGGNTQQIIINPQKDAVNGIFETTRNVQSMLNGSFSVSVNISPPK